MQCAANFNVSFKCIIVLVLYLIGCSLFVIIVYVMSVNLCILGWCDWREANQEGFAHLGRIHG